MARYATQPPPRGDLDATRAWLEEELERIRGALDAIYDGEMEGNRIAPTNPRNGTLAVTIPGGWDPGGGAGFYGYVTTTTASGTWVKF